MAHKELYKVHFLLLMKILRFKSSGVLCFASG